MAQPRIQYINAARRLAQRPLEIRASFSSSAVVRADDPSRTTAADGLLASLDEHEPSRSLSLSRPRARPLPQPVRLEPKHNSHTPSNSTNQRVSNLIAESRARYERQKQNLLAGRRPGQPSLTTVQELDNAKKASDLSRHIARRWKAGDVYAPHDLSAAEAAKWKKRAAPKHDVFDLLDFKPLENYKNFSVMSEYMSSTGRIMPSKQTGLRPVNQRKIAKAIRRSVGMGIMPSIYRHPELLQKMALKQEQTPAKRN